MMFATMVANTIMIMMAPNYSNKSLVSSMNTNGNRQNDRDRAPASEMTADDNAIGSMNGLKYETYAVLKAFSVVIEIIYQ